MDATRGHSYLERMSENHGVSDPEIRFARATEWGIVPPSHRPELGPCLIYKGADNGNGYGQFRFDGRNDYAHRYAWVRSRGPIPKGMTVDHLCRVRRCCNVEHLELVSGVENYLRGVRTRTHCRNGHQYPVPGLGNRCKVCAKIQHDKLAAKRARVANGLPDLRIKYNQTDLYVAIRAAADREISVAEAARRIGCSPKYMDKRVRRFKRTGK